MLRFARRFRSLITCACLFALLNLPAGAYSVQTHEQLIDLTWLASIVPLLQTRFPGITAAQLQEAHAYAYGGAAIQDVGYYPFGNQFFSNLTHYVRSGDFVNALLLDARTPDELAFAVGALSHYIGDSVGHAEATNPSVAAQFAGLAHRFGPVVTYEESPHGHVRTEFAFDIDQISKKRFAPRRYLNHVGLYVSTDLLARAFYETYGLDLNKILTVERTSLFGYRYSVRHLLPRLAYAENVLHRNRFPDDPPSADLTAIEADLRQASQDNGWEAYRGTPGIGTHILAGLIYVTPHIGILSDLAIRGPNQDAEFRYIRSLNQTAKALRAALVNLRTPPPATGPAPQRQIDFPNLDLDTGLAARPGGYRLTDRTYAKLVQRLTEKPSTPIPADLKEDVLAYYADPAAPITTKKKPVEWARLQEELKTLQTMPTIPATVAR